MERRLNIKILDMEAGGILVTEINDLAQLNAIRFPMLVELDIHTFENDELKLLPILSNKERQKYITYKHWKDARRYILSRAALRLILSNFCLIPYSKLEFGETIDKKPFLVQSGQRKIEFNLSHTDKKIVIAVDEHPIGVDVESSINNIRTDLIGKRVLTIQEQISVANSTNAKRAFCLYWTRKEAFLKAIGKGIDDDIVKVPALEGQYQYWLSDTFGYDDWTIASLEGGDDHIVSLAFQSQSATTKPSRIKLSKASLLTSLR